MADCSDHGEMQSSAGMPPLVPESSPHEDRLFQAVQQYLQELEQGRHPTRKEWLARFPDLFPELDECLDALNFMRDAATGLQPTERRTTETAGNSAGLQPGMPLGDFQIVREIGRGGMGIVYEALQLSLGRSVALKTLPLAAGLDTKYLQRFRQESQAAARLHHTNIVPVYAVGCERGVNFYAMQLIDGESLDRIIWQLRVNAGVASPEPPANGQASQPSVTRWLELPVTEPYGADAAASVSSGPCSSTVAGRHDTRKLTDLSAGLSTGGNHKEVYRALARLMAQAAEALEYAHQQGIIHRDIKPGNLLIDIHHNLWITDFGLAHLHGESDLTRTGDLLGTIRYASPEQVSGQRVALDGRTDLYSLGATFYELLTLRPVFSGQTRQALLQQILNQEPTSPRAIDRDIPIEFDTILLKLLSKLPGERYNSAQEVADDLHRFLRDEPILARPPSFLERVRKWGRRHPAYVAALIIVMFATLVISGVSNWFVVQANNRTRTALLAERARAEEAERNFLQARQAVDYMIKVSENDLASKFPLQPLQRRILETALTYYRDFIAQHRSDPAQEAELLAVQQRLVKALDDLAVLECAGQLVLLGEKDVQADLKLGAAERQRFDAIAQTFNDLRSEVLHNERQLPIEERRARFLALARNSRQAMQAVLSQQQLSRLRQILLQIQGISAFNQPEIVDQLKLTDEQWQAMRAIEVETYFLLGERLRSCSEQQRDTVRKEVLGSAMAKSLAILTPSQLAAWRKLIGPPFHGHLSVIFPGFRPEL